MTDRDSKSSKCEFGIVGLGTMGRNLALNVADHGFAVAGYDRDLEKVRTLRREAGSRRVCTEESLADFLDSLRRPRAVMMLVPAGAPVDSVIADLAPHMSAGDLLIDGGNSHFADTEQRAAELQRRNIQYLGIGISGGEEGARHGPSIMPGGPRDAYDRVRPVFEAAAARVGKDPCVAWLGPSSSGHYTKMVHNGIEYGIMQLISEIYDLMKRGLGLDNDAMHDAFARWSSGDLGSYLIEITARILQQVDPSTGGRLVDSIRDEAEQLGTGKWTSQSALDLGVPIPTIDSAVAMRALSEMKEERERATAVLSARIEPIEAERETILRMFENALYASSAIVYAQGFALLRRASDARRYDLDLEAIARIWRGGCIIRAAILERIRAAFRERADLANLLLDPAIGPSVTARQEDLRSVACVAARSGTPAPGIMSSLGYLDAYRCERLPANLIQAQRDYFGAHTYRRIGQEGVFHTEWSREENA